MLVQETIQEHAAEAAQAASGKFDAGKTIIDHV